MHELSADEVKFNLLNHAEQKAHLAAQRACQSQSAFVPEHRTIAEYESAVLSGCEPVASHQRILARDCCEGLPVVVDCPDAGHYVHPQGRAMRVKSVGCNPAHTKQDSANCKATIDSSLPSDAAARKSIPMCTGLLDYFPDALSAVAACSKAGNDQHNPGQPLHWARGKSTDQADCIVRHLMERGKIDTDGVRHSAKVAWRSLALLQLEIEADRNTSK